MCKKFGIPFLKTDGTESTLRTKPMSEEEKLSPFVDYGFGIQAWIKTLWFLFLTYCVLSLLAFVNMKQYESFNGLEKDDTMFGKFTKFSLGNVGFAKSQCFFQYYPI